ncbi:MAG: hypothetical protein HDS41_07315 [Bacteroides sp.]|nr:hypothetical protein [Bacteroides sp.]
MGALKTLSKSALGLIYTVLIMLAIEAGLIWLTRYLIFFNWTWGWALAFWVIGLPLIIGIFQFLATISAIPAVYLMKGSKALGWILLLPAIYFIVSWGYFLYNVASSIGGILTWLIFISWFAETAWFFGAYSFIAIGSAYEHE